MTLQIEKRYLYTPNREWAYKNLFFCVFIFCKLDTAAMKTKLFLKHYERFETFEIIPSS